MADTIESFVRAGSFRESWKNRFQNKWPAMTTMMMRTESEIDYPNITPCPDFGIKNPSIRSWTSSTQDTWAESRDVDQAMTDVESSSSHVTKKGTRCGRICNGVLCVFLVLSVVTAVFAGIGLAILLTLPEFGLAGHHHSHDDSHIDAGLNESEQKFLTEKFCNLVKDILKDTQFPIEKGIASCEAALQLMKGSEGLHIELHVIPNDGYTLKEKFIRALGELMTVRRDDITTDSKPKINISRSTLDKFDRSNFIFSKTGGVFTFNPDDLTTENKKLGKESSFSKSTVPWSTQNASIERTTNIIPDDIQGTTLVKLNGDRNVQLKAGKSQTKVISGEGVELGRINNTELMPLQDNESLLLHSNSTKFNADRKVQSALLDNRTLQESHETAVSLTEASHRNISNISSFYTETDITNEILNDKRFASRRNITHVSLANEAGLDRSFEQNHSSIEVVTPDVTSASTNISELTTDDQNDTLTAVSGIVDPDTVTNIRTLATANKTSVANNMKSDTVIGNKNYTITKQNESHDALVMTNASVYDHNISIQLNQMQSIGNNGNQKTTAVKSTKEEDGVISSATTGDFFTSTINTTSFSASGINATVSDAMNTIQGITESSYLNNEAHIVNNSDAVSEYQRTVPLIEVQALNDAQGNRSAPLSNNTSLENTDVKNETGKVNDIKSITLFDVHNISNTNDSVPIYVNETAVDKSEKDVVAESLMAGGVFKLPMRTTSKFKFLFSSGTNNKRHQRTRPNTKSVVVVNNRHSKNSVK